MRVWWHFLVNNLIACLINNWLCKSNNYPKQATLAHYWRELPDSSLDLKEYEDIIKTSDAQQDGVEFLVCFKLEKPL